MREFKKDQTLCREGDPANVLYVLMAGKLAIYKGSVKIAEFTERGTLLGEISAILNTPRTASIVALEDTTVMEIARDLDLLLKRYPDVVKKILLTLAERLVKTTEEYWYLSEKIDIKH